MGAQQALGTPKVEIGEWYLVFDNIFTLSSGAAVMGQAVQAAGGGGVDMQNCYTVKPIGINWPFILWHGFTGSAAPKKNPHVQHGHAFDHKEEQETYTEILRMGKGLRFSNIFKESNNWIKLPPEVVNTIPKDDTVPLAGAATQV